MIELVNNHKLRCEKLKLNKKNNKFQINAVRVIITSWSFQLEFLKFLILLIFFNKFNCIQLKAGTNWS